ncbi:hypothetical protein ACTI_29610 [Actinoplanes sp. OR16]|uniref:hypothetical protein n=1 Tax=Actinoplanes sp. OR16 TaxID=946334 RepID=UPI000F6B33BB|nr:hypothetical protein [Actinoplanes sp. OR16]BBH66276.1 hypothetical protein ACTI_29610 [Actinoplanes sp. OR16]
MALLRKESRLVTVDGVVYRWRVRKRPSRPAPLSFAVEQADRRGAILLATLPEPPTWSGVPRVPALVADMVRQGREQGWRPDEPGSAFPLRAA